MKAIKWLDENFEEFIMIIFLILLTCIMMLQVVMRYFFHAPLSWAEEACRYSFVYSVMLATAYCIRKGKMLRVDVVINLFPPIIAKLLDLIAQLMAIIFCIILLKPSWNVMMSAYKIGNVSSGLELPMWILYTSAPVGFVLGIVRGVEVFIFSMKDFVKLLKGKGEQA